jgi:hypothetical protein
MRDRAIFAGRANRRLWWLVPPPAVVAGCIPHESALDADVDRN